MYLECFNCGTEMTITIEITEEEEIRITKCPICHSDDIELGD